MNVPIRGIALIDPANTTDGSVLIAHSSVLKASNRANSFTIEVPRSQKDVW
jgi:hypothetical protein